MWFISFHLPWFKNEDESTMLQYYFFFFLMKYVGKILYDSEKIIKKKKWYSIFRLLNKPFWKRIWIDIFKIWKIHRIVTFIKNIKRERKKKEKVYRERLMRDRRSVSKSKNVFPGSWWSISRRIFSFTRRNSS